MDTTTAPVTQRRKVDTIHVPLFLPAPSKLSNPHVTIQRQTVVQTVFRQMDNAYRSKVTLAYRMLIYSLTLPTMH